MASDQPGGKPTAVEEQPVGVPIDVDPAFYDDLPTAVDLNPEAARQLGRLVVAWSIVEALVTALFARLIDDRGPVAAAVLHQVASLQHRLEVINDVADELLSDRRASQRLKALTGEVRRLSRERNRFVHGIWGVNRYSGRLYVVENLTTKKARKEQEATADEIAGVVNEVVALRTRLRDYAFPPNSPSVDLRRPAERQSP